MILVKFSKKQLTDSGMALVLILLILGWFLEDNIYFNLAIPALLVNMAFPHLIWPFAFVWLNLSKVLGAIMSRVLLSFAYMIVLTPIGFLMRSVGNDSLVIRKFKRSRRSVLIERNHIFEPEDLEKPY